MATRVMIKIIAIITMVYLFENIFIVSSFFLSVWLGVNISIIVIILILNTFPFFDLLFSFDVRDVV